MSERTFSFEFSFDQDAVARLLGVVDRPLRDGAPKIFNCLLRGVSIDDGAFG